MVRKIEKIKKARFFFGMDFCFQTHVKNVCFTLYYRQANLALS